MNTRAILKLQGKEWQMVDLQRILAQGFAAMVVREERMTVKESDSINKPEVELLGGVQITVTGPSHRLDNSFHPWNSRGSVRRQCLVHNKKRCLTNKYCVKCNAALCSGAAFTRYHTLEDFTE